MNIYLLDKEQFIKRCDWLWINKDWNIITRELLQPFDMVIELLFMKYLKWEGLDQSLTRNLVLVNTTQKMKFSIKHSFSKYDQIRIFLRIWSHLLMKSLMENFIFCVGKITTWVTINNSIRVKFILVQKQPPRGVLKKRCSENMHQIYKRTPIFPEHLFLGTPLGGCFYWYLL